MRIKIIFTWITFFLLNTTGKNQNVNIVYREVRPIMFEKVRICKVQIPEDLEDCISHMMKNTRCSVVKRDSNEVFAIRYSFLTKVGEEWIFLNGRKGYDACFERCTLYIELEDLFYLRYSNEYGPRWLYGGYFDIDGDLFFIVGGDKRDDDEYCSSRYLDSEYFGLTEDCMEIEVPVLGKCSYKVEDPEKKVISVVEDWCFYKDDMWPHIEVVVESGRVVSCNFLCHLYEGFSIYVKKIRY